MHQGFTPWTPVEYTTIRSANHAQQLTEKGFVLLKDFLTHDILNQLDEIHQQHPLEIMPGTFWGVYSPDTTQRTIIHQKVGEVLKLSINSLFFNYKMLLNSFVIKTPGIKTGFSVHQDTTYIDELKFSPISCWIPLNDITPENGAMCFIEKTHKLFSPYRGSSFPFPFSGHDSHLATYMEPVFMKKGDLLVFDPRTIHYSLPNLSLQNRTCVVCGIFPAESIVQICYRSIEGGPIELYAQQDTFGLDYTRFNVGVKEKPLTGKFIGLAEEKYVLNQLSNDEIESKFDSVGIKRKYLLQMTPDEQIELRP